MALLVASMDLVWEVGVEEEEVVVAAVVAVEEAAVAVAEAVAASMDADDTQGCRVVAPRLEPSAAEEGNKLDYCCDDDVRSKQQEQRSL